MEETLQIIKKHKLNNSSQPEIYYDFLQRPLAESPPTCLYELGQIAVQSAEAGSERFQGPKGVKRPAQSLELKDLCIQRKEARNMQTRKDLRKKIQRQARNEVPLWKTKGTEYFFQKFAIQHLFKTLIFRKFDQRHVPSTLKHLRHSSKHVFY